MAEIVTMPKMSDTMTEGTIAAWHKKVGDKVSSGELMAEIETDKATMEYESYNDGTVLYLGCKEGESVIINGIMAIVGQPGEDYSALLAGATSAPAEAAPVAETSAPDATAPSSSAPKIDISGIKAEIVSMPKMSDTMVAGTIATWNKKVGDKVASGELLAEIETDKATMEYESYSAGTLLYIGAQAGESVLINAPLAVIGEPGADYQTLLKAHEQESAPKTETPAPVAAAPVQASAPVPTAAPKATTSTEAKKPGRLEKVSSSPLARKLAFDRGFNLAAIAGTGPNNRITKYDVDNYVPVASASAGVSVAASGVESSEEVKLNGMRKAIAKKVSDSKFTAPHFYITMDINMDKAIAARTSMNASGDVKISFNDLVVKAVAVALKKHPKVNSHWLGDAIRYNHHVHVGVAISVGDALYIPKIEFTDTLSLSQISSKVKELAGKVKEGKVSTEEMTGGTFTISNLGMFGVDSFTAILNPPATCILAVGGISKVPVVKGDQIVPGNVMKVTLSCDHRAVDGAVGAAFLQDLKNYLEDPIRMLV
jgi:pyruvate dehydrogenase E2 component (dihydrolipoamide acetyltransferase)